MVLQLSILDHNVLDKRGKTILSHYLFGDKIIQNCLKIDATHYYNNDLVLKQETQKRLHILEVDMITIKKTLMSLAQGVLFYKTCSKWRL